MKPQNPQSELISEFDSAPDSALFPQEHIAAFTRISVKKLERDRWQGIGVPFCRIGRCVRYRKSDVLQYLEQNAFLKKAASQ